MGNVLNVCEKRYINNNTNQKQIHVYKQHVIHMENTIYNYMEFEFFIIFCFQTFLPSPPPLHFLFPWITGLILTTFSTKGHFPLKENVTGHIE